jgi:hypothetical protein
MASKKATNEIIVVFCHCEISYDIRSDRISNASERIFQVNTAENDSNEILIQGLMFGAGRTIKPLLAAFGEMSC